MSTFAFRFIADAQAITAIQQLAVEQQVRLSQPQPLDSTVEPLNAPITGGEIEQVALVVSAVFASGSAALAFFDKLLDLVRKLRRPVQLRRSGTSGAILVGPDTDADSIKKAFPGV